MQKIELPISYEKIMKEMLGDEFADYYNSFEKEAYQGIRINTSKISVEDFLSLTSLDLKPVAWCPNGFYYDKNEKPAKHPYYFAGLYYIQEPSAMTPASLLPIKEGDIVLDICAAPGGKSTELASKLNGSGLLISNDISNSRAKALLKNIEVFGVPNALITSEPPNILAKRFPAFFDKILIDAPCSGEGMFRKQNNMMKAWEQNGVDLFVNLQHSILKEAVTMLKPGGIIIYSTCTFSKEENEQSIEYLLSLDSSLHLMELPMIDGFDCGHPNWGITGNEELKKCRRLWPHKIDGEGHFVAMVKKDSAEFTNRSASGYIFSNQKLSDEARTFIKEIDFPFDANRFDVINEHVYYIPKEMPDIKGLRVLRCGLYMGDMKKNRFEPSQSLAMFLKQHQYKNRVELSVLDERVIKYLKGETIFLSDEENKQVRDGICLISVDGYSLGFGKNNNGKIKNKYLSGWRWM